MFTLRSDLLYIFIQFYSGFSNKNFIESQFQCQQKHKNYIEKENLLAMKLRLCLPFCTVEKTLKKRTEDISAIKKGLKCENFFCLPKIFLSCSFIE
jgi:hypothetical protein